MEGVHLSDLSEIYSTYGRQLYLFALRLTGNSHEAEDLVQETFLLAFRSLDSFKGESSVKTWLFSIAINKHRDQLRKSRRYFSDAEADNEAVPCPRPNPYDSFEQQEKAQRIRSALRSLPENYRTALILVRFQEMTYKEAGQALGTTLETVRMRVHRGHLMLAQLLKEYG
jgi:RNA polymerase sigma-70 factor, ECF subfamily